jgi:hypothetical protein
LLLIQEGHALVQEQGKPLRNLAPGESIFPEPNVPHWHGATPTQSMAHLNVRGSRGSPSRGGAASGDAVLGIVRVSTTAPGRDPFRDHFAGGRILAETERMQELVNEDDLSSRAILRKAISELRSADANDRRTGLSERQRLARSTLRRLAVIEEPHWSEGFGWTPAACLKSCRKALADLIRKVAEEILAAGTTETSGGPLKRALHGRSSVALRMKRCQKLADSLFRLGFITADSNTWITQPF